MGVAVSTAAVAYFSGTGGARRVAESFRKALESRGIAAGMMAMDRSLGEAEQSFTKPDLLVLVFAVHAFDAPTPVYAWVKGIDLNGVRAAVVSVSGGGEKWPNTGCRNGIIHALEARGAEVVHEKMAVMPCNWVMPIGDEAAMHLINYLPSMAIGVIDGILSGKIVRTGKKKGFVRRWITAQEQKHAHEFIKGLKVGGACTGCGKCQRQCPMRNIVLNSGKPAFGEACVMCFRCVYACPAHALETKNFMVLKGGFDLDALEKRMRGRGLPPVEQCFKGFMWKPVLGYLLGWEGY